MKQKGKRQRPDRRAKEHAWVDRRLLFIVGLIAMVAACAYAVPQWWTDQQVLVPGAPAHDYAAVNQGQLKNLARAARDEMLAKGVIETGHPIDLMVEAWRQNTAGATDYAPVNAGQVKALAKPFYDRLIELGMRDAGSYPWAGVAMAASDYAPVNAGQVKNVFAFDIPLMTPLPWSFSYGRGEKNRCLV